jgi:hypothetical protein
VGARFSAPVQTGPGAHSASCTMGTGSFPEVKYGRGVLLTTHPLLVPWSRKSRAISPPTLWATPGLKRGYFTFYHPHGAQFFPYYRLCPPLHTRHILNIARYAATSQPTNEVFLLIFYKCSFSKERSVLPEDGRITETCRS